MLITPVEKKVYINQHNNDKFSRLFVVVEPYLFFSLVRSLLVAGVRVRPLDLGVLQVMASHFKIIRRLGRPSWDAIKYRHSPTMRANEKVVTALFLSIFQFLMRENVFEMLAGPGIGHPPGNSERCGAHWCEKEKNQLNACVRTVTAISNSICMKVKFKAIIRLLGRCDCERAV